MSHIQDAVKLYRQVQAMAVAQSAFDAMEPPAYFDDEPAYFDEDVARDEATAEVLCTPEVAADTIAKLCATPEGRKPLDVSKLADVDVIDGTAAQCIAVIVAGTDKSAVLTAAGRLAELIVAAQADVIEENVQSARLAISKAKGGAA